MSETVTFDHYAVLQRDDGSLYELGRGAMGITYKAFDQNLRIPVALKVINGTYLNSPVARQRFVREARAAAKLRHRHVASVFHLAIEGETMFYAMEFIDGETVDALIKRQGPLAPVLALQIVDQVARALNAAQVHGLVHRDIKPANLMLIREDDELTVKVIDFGLAKTLTPGEEDAATVSQGGFVGTPHFASPEQLEEREIDVRSDIYSLGVTLWYMLAGQTPFAGSMAQVMSQHLAKPPPFERLASIPPPVATLLRRMLEKDRALRPQSPSELRLEVERALAQIRSNAKPGEDPAVIDPDDYATVFDDPAARAPATTFEVGAVIADRYRIVAALGDTNTGVIFRAERIDDGAPMRLLVLHRELTSEPATYTQIDREVEKVSTVQHPNLLRVYGLETIDTTSFIAMEWTEGFSLLELLRARRELESVEVLKLLSQAAEGVDFALANGLKRLDLHLHQVFIHFGLPIEKHAYLHQPVNQWPAFTLKVSPLGITRELSASETFAGQQTMVGGAGHSTTETSELVRAIQALGGVVYELLGGTLSPLGTSTGLGIRYTPLANLSEKGNEALRYALAPIPPYAKASEFFRTLADADDGITESIVLPSPPVPTAPASLAGRSVARAPQPTIPPALPPHGQSSPSGAPLAIAAMLVALLLAGAGTYFYILPLFKKPAQEVVNVEPPIEDDSPPVTPNGNDEPDTPDVTPSTTPIPPKKTDPPPPSRTQLLKLAARDAETVEAAEDWPTAIEAWSRVQREYPESDVGKVRLEMMIERLRGRGVETNTKELPALRDAMLEAAQLNVVAAMMFLGENLRGTEPENSFAWYSAAAAQGQLPALTMIGLMLSNGYGTEKDLAKAVECLRSAADQGYAPAKTALADCYIHGTNVPKSDKIAVELLTEAAELGDARAMDLLGSHLHQTAGTLDKNPGEKNRLNSEALRLFTRASELGYARSFGNLAVLYLNGDGVSRSNTKAVELIQKGLRANDDFAFFLYARCLENNIGVGKNLPLAREFYIKAAEAGNPGAIDWCRRNKIDLPNPAPRRFFP